VLIVARNRENHTSGAKALMDLAHQFAGVETPTYQFCRFEAAAADLPFCGW
jgi:hypothetical protein